MFVNIKNIIFHTNWRQWMDMDATHISRSARPTDEGCVSEILLKFADGIQPPKKNERKNTRKTLELQWKIAFNRSPAAYTTHNSARCGARDTNMDTNPLDDGHRRWHSHCCGAGGFDSGQLSGNKSMCVGL